MGNTENYTQKMARAVNRVQQIKKFHHHLLVYLIVNALLFMAKILFFDQFALHDFEDPNFIDWVEWNVIGTPLLWGIGLLGHALHVFLLQGRPLAVLKPHFLKDWEDRQLQKYLKE